MGGAAALLARTPERTRAGGQSSGVGGEDDEDGRRESTMACGSDFGSLPALVRFMASGDDETAARLVIFIGVDLVEGEKQAAYKAETFSPGAKGCFRRLSKGRAQLPPLAPGRG